ncbi:fibronectin type III domain-containing protein [uncultured Bifidobacterium sp.]|uniref:fibronectin type III domain-containing protein n=1 Tax=uncultured Bifidobacterium sp. TaxID=165187 RepID=UPI0025EA3EA0|nr:fibronectin type III domain-containing protein [uncultured Bifidobacterium sp.]
MADGYGNQVGYWRVHVAAWVTSYTDTTDTIHVEARWQSVAAGWDYSGWVAATVWINGQQVNHTGNSGNKYINNSEVTVLTGDLTVAKTDGARNITCSASIAWNGFHPGTSNASCSVPVGGINYKKPNPPKNVKWSRVDDSKVNCTWQAAYDNSALKPWKQIITDWRSSTGGANWGAWSNKATLNWDATNYSYTGLKANSRYQFSLYARNQAGDSSHVDSQVIYTTPDPPKSVTAVKTGDRTVQITADVSNTYASWVILWRRVNGGDWEAVQKDGAHYRLAPLNGKCVFTDSDAPGGTLEYECFVRRVIYGDGSGMSTPLDDTLCSTAKVSNSVTTITPPLAPTVSCEQGAVAPTNTALVFRWTPNHPDGTAQTSAEVEVTRQDGSVGTATITGATTSYTRPASNQTVGTVKFRVRTKGLDADWGAWSSYVEVRIADPPSVVINGPASPVTAMPFTIAWSIADVTGVSMQTVEILRGGSVVWSRQSGTGVRELEITSTDFLPSNGDQLQIRVSVRGGSTLTAAASTLVDVEYTPPASPTVNIQYDANLNGIIQLTFNRTEPGTITQEYWTRSEGEPDNSPSVLANFYTVSLGEPDNSPSVLVPLSEGEWRPETTYATVYRVNPDGSQTLIADNLGDGQQCIDRLPPLNIDYSYRVVAHAESGATQDKPVATRIVTRCCALNFGVDASDALLLDGGYEISENPSLATEEYHFALGSDDGLPMSYDLADLDNTIRFSTSYDYQWDDGATYRRIRRLSRRYAYAWWRGVDGSRAYVRAAIGQQLAAAGPKVSLTVDMTELAWEEPNG